MPGPLDGFRVVDLTAMISGPLGTQILADQGADVIKIEPPVTGDFTRLSSNRQGGLSASFLNNNRNKRSVALHLKEEKGKAALRKIIKGADVFIQNFRPGVIERMGFGEDAVREIQPDIIYVSIAGFGFEGPYASKPVYDPLIQALSGLTTVQAGSDNERPRLVRTILPDKLTGFASAQAITAALLSRMKTGMGQHIRLSMLDTVVSFLWGSDMSSQTFLGNEFAQERAQSFIDLIYETTDGYISVAVQSDKEWTALTRALDVPEWLDDPRFKTAQLRQENINDRLQMTQDRLRMNSSAFWLQRLEAEDVPCAPVLRRSDMIDHPQIAANGIIQEFEHHSAGSLRQARLAARFSETDMDYRRGAPLLGEHSVEILEEAGLTSGEIAELLDSGIANEPAKDAAE